MACQVVFLGMSLCLRDVLKVTPLLSPPALAAGQELGHV